MLQHSELIHVRYALVLAFLILALAACSPQATTQPPPAEATATRPAVVPTRQTTRTPTEAATATRTLDPVMAAHVAWLTSTPRDLEDLTFHYDPSATPDLPPESSVNMPIWGDSLPLRTFHGRPEFITYPAPVVERDSAALLAEAGCMQSQGRDIECGSASPLTEFGCDYLFGPTGYYVGLDPDQHVLARCLYWPEDPDEARDTYLYRSGCAFRMDVGYILEDQGAYVLVDTAQQLRELLLPIDSPGKAMTYVELMTGLAATYSFEDDPYLIYTMDPVEGTHITEQDGVFTLNMFHYQTCLCEPWVNSVVDLSVDREGRITWLGAAPWSLTLGFSCAD